MATKSRDAAAPALRREQDDLPQGFALGRYRIEEPVGRGGMGTVYRAFDAATNRFVAIKLLAEGISEPLRERFLAECEAEAQIRHEHIMPVYDQGWYTDTRPYFVMELVYEPITLDEIIDLGRRSQLGSRYPRIRKWAHLPHLVEDVLLPVVEGIAHANIEHRIQHRDLKPENVLIDVRTRRPYVIDFGICRDLDAPNPEAGKIIGTPRFLSPEQASGTDHPTTDVWGLGVLLRFALTGEPPLEGTSPFSRSELNKRIEALRKAHQKAEANKQEVKAEGYAARIKQLQDPSLRTTDDLIREAREGAYTELPTGVSPAYVAIVRKAMAPQPKSRYRDARALAADLRAWLDGRAVGALQDFGGRGAALDRARRLLYRHRTNLAVGGGAALAGTLLGLAFFGRTPPAPDYRAQDAAADHAAIAEALAETDLPVAVLRARDARLRAASARVAARSGVAPRPPLPGPHGATVRIQGAALPKIHALSPLAPERLPSWAKVPSGALQTLPVGWWRLRGEGLDAAVYVPATGTRSVRLAIGDAGSKVPPGALTVLAPTGPLWASKRRVTYQEYAEWLDLGLDAGARAKRVPPKGFHAERGMAGRYLVDSAYRGKAIRGLRMADIEAYIAWRSELDGVPYALPTPGQWEAMAGVHLLQLPQPDHAFARYGTSQDGSTRSYEQHVPSPYGLVDLFDAQGELVRSSDGALGTKGVNGALPRREALTRTTPLSKSADARIEVPFRLVSAGP